MKKLKANYTVLAIETSLDDTCCSVTQDDKVLSSVVASQVEFHEEYGGTVPHIARQKHMEMIDEVVVEALIRARLIKKKNLLDSHCKLDLESRRLEAKSTRSRIESGMTVLQQGMINIDAVAVTCGPGLAPSLEVGIKKAKELAKLWKKPLIAVNHLEGHLLSSFANNSKGNGPLRSEKLNFPYLGFIISGGHTELVLMKGFGDYQLLGQTLDDAAGEAYDKVARMLGLGYPGGPILSELAKEGEPIYDLPEPMRHRPDLDVSFSGLKTAAMYKLRKLNRLNSDSKVGAKNGFSRQFCADFAASFQKAAFQMLLRRFERAIERYSPNGILLGGGVVSNVQLRHEVRKVARKYGLRVHIPYTKKLFTDNAAMIGLVAWHKAKRGEFFDKANELDRVPGLNFEK